MKAEERDKMLDEVLAWAKRSAKARRTGEGEVEHVQQEWFVAADTPGGSYRLNVEEPQRVTNWCKMPHCIGGHLALMLRAEPVFEYGNDATGKVRTPEGGIKYAGAFVQEQLGLSEPQSDALFYSENTLQDIERIIRDIKTGDL